MAALGFAVQCRSFAAFVALGSILGSCCIGVVWCEFNCIFSLETELDCKTPPIKHYQLSTMATSLCPLLFSRKELFLLKQQS